MVQEKLSLHQVEREVMERPPKNRHTDLEVEAPEVGHGVVFIATLPAENCERLESEVDGNGSGRGPPNYRIADEVDLTIIFTPKVDSTLQDRPARGTGVPSVRFDETGISAPHDLVQFPELAKEAGVAVVDPLDIAAELGVLVLLDVPNTVGERSALRAGYLLLFVTPVRKLDLVGKEEAAGHGVDELELCLDSAESLLCFGAIRKVLDDLDPEDVVCVTLEIFVSIRRNFILPVGLTNRWPDIMRMQTFISRGMVESNQSSILDENRWGNRVETSKSQTANGVGLVFNNPDVVLVLVWVQGDLLLLGAGGVHVIV